MIQRRKKVAVALVSFLAVCLLAVALVWLLSRQANDADHDAATEGDALTEDQQTPVAAPEAPGITEAPDEADAPDSSVLTEKTTNGGAAIPNHFATLDEARNFFARLVGEEYDILEADESIVFPEEPLSEEEAKERADFKKEIMESFDNNPEAMPWGFDDPEASRIRELAWMAYDNVHARVFMKDERNEYAGLRKALEPVLGSGFEPMEELVRAGRLPEEVLYNKARLPNGKIYNLLPNTELVVNYQVKAKLTKRERRRLLENEQRELDLLSRLACANLSESETSKLNGELTNVQRELARIRKPVYSNHQSKYTSGSPDHIDFKRIELNLGVLDIENEPHPPGVNIPDDLLPADE